MGSRLYKVETIGSGFLAAMAKPAAGEWADDEFAGIAAAGIRQVVSLLEPSEAYQVGLGDEQKLCEQHRIKFTSYPIPDRGLPSSVSGFAQLTRSLYHEIAGGKNTVVHCHAGIGRTGMVAAGILLHGAYGPEEAFARVSETRGVSVPDTDEQYHWVVSNCGEITSAPSR